jgi:hypothetical protein
VRTLRTFFVNFLEEAQENHRAGLESRRAEVEFAKQDVHHMCTYGAGHGCVVVVISEECFFHSISAPLWSQSNGTDRGVNVERRRW